MKTFLRKFQFEIDGKIINTEYNTILIEESETSEVVVAIGEGKTFESLWSFMEKHSLLVPANCWKRAFWSKKRRIEFFTHTKTWIDNGVERIWKATYIDTPIEVTMKELFKFDSEDVIKYLTERNLKIGVDK